MSYPRTRLISEIDLLGWTPSGYPIWNHLRNIQNLLEQGSKVSYPWTGVISKIDLLGWTLSGYPRCNYFRNIQNLLEPASRVSYTRTGVVSKIDLLGWTLLGYPRWNCFRNAPWSKPYLEKLLDCCSTLSKAWGVVLEAGYRSDEWEQCNRFVGKSTFIKNLSWLQQL